MQEDCPVAAVMEHFEAKGHVPFAERLAVYRPRTWHHPRGLGQLPGASGVGQHHKTSAASLARGWLSNYPGGFLL